MFDLEGAFLGNENQEMGILKGGLRGWSLIGPGGGYENLGGIKILHHQKMGGIKILHYPLMGGIKISKFNFQNFSARCARHTLKTIITMQYYT